METVSCDVLIVGSGGAGLCAARAAAKAGADVLIAGKGKINRSGATLLAGADVSADIACAGEDLCKLGLRGNPDDTRESWYSDIVHEGFFLNDRDMVQLFVDTAGERVGDLVEAGVKLHNLEIGEREIGAAGHDILNTLWKAVRGCGNVRMREDITLCDLLTAKGRVCGALLLDINGGALVRVDAGAVVLATGGAHNCYTFTSGPSDLCGEGIAAALRAGARLVNMEMVTHCPGVMFAPQKHRGSILPYVFQCLNAGVDLNGAREPYLHKHLSPAMVRLALGSEWNKLLLCYAAYMEREATGGDEYGGLIYRVGMPGTPERAALEQKIPHLRQGNFGAMMDTHDQNGGLCVFPAAHYFDGGIQVNARMETTLQGLFAAGECTGGLFGANRVSAATTEMMVEGARAGLSAALFATQAGRGCCDQASMEAATQGVRAPVGREGGLTATAAKQAVKEAVSRHGGIVRTREGLEAGLRALDEIDLENIGVGKTGRYPGEWLDYLEARAMHTCGRSILRASLLREESRGVFIRGDCLFTDDDNWLRNVVEGPCGLETVPVAQGRIASPGGKRDYFDYLEGMLSKLSYYEG